MRNSLKLIRQILCQVLGLPVQVIKWTFSFLKEKYADLSLFHFGLLDGEAISSDNETLQTKSQTDEDNETEDLNSLNEVANEDMD